MVFYVIFYGIGGMLLGWKYGGGVIPLIIFLSACTFIWRIITKKSISNEQKSDEKKVD
jgi:hypothetical protein